jgi:hypothetical protein
LFDHLKSEANRTKEIFSTWNKPFFSNTHEVFTFKYYNNIAGINSRIQDINSDINAACIFCIVNENLPTSSKKKIQAFDF